MKSRARASSSSCAAETTLAFKGVPAERTPSQGCTKWQKKKGLVPRKQRAQKEGDLGERRCISADTETKRERRRFWASLSCRGPGEPLLARICLPPLRERPRRAADLWSRSAEESSPVMSPIGRIKIQSRLPPRPLLLSLPSLLFSYYTFIYFPSRVRSADLGFFFGTCVSARTFCFALILGNTHCVRVGDFSQSARFDTQSSSSS